MENPSCTKHVQKAARWNCATCQLPLCEECHPVGFQGKIYCNTCQASTREIKTEKVYSPGNTSIGVKWIGWYYIVGGIISLVFCLIILIIALIALISLLFSQTSQISAMGWKKALEPVGPPLMVFLMVLLFCALSIASSIMGDGLLHLKKWARKMIMILAGWEVLGGIILLISSISHKPIFILLPHFQLKISLHSSGSSPKTVFQHLVSNSLWYTVSLVILWYLSKRSVKEQFGIRKKEIVS
ncbi:MAG: B-box zinc finger protein [Chlamydiae bacterium]|nr:B-box zinc finger protein [Chlamydiota bacterium]